MKKKSNITLFCRFYSYIRYKQNLTFRLVERDIYQYNELRRLYSRFLSAGVGTLT